jgi:hypothetical protein
MLEPDQWNAVLSRVTGMVYRGTERISSNALLNLLEVGPDPVIRQKVGKRLVSHMQRLGWTGPRAMRIPETTGTVQGYWRRPGQLPRSHSAGMPVAGEFCDDVGLSDDLPAALEQVTRLGLKKLEKILRVPLDPTDGNLVRSQVTAAGIAVNAQLRADEQRLRTKQTGDVLARLLKIIEQEKKAHPECYLAVPQQQVEQVELERSDAEATLMASGGDGSEEGVRPDRRSAPGKTSS